jgi:hypothetical protein
MATSPETTTTAPPAHLHHDDLRARSILVLAESYNDDTTLSTADRETIVRAMLPNVPAAQAVDAFRTVVSDLLDATDYDTRGEDAVLARFGSWSARGPRGLTADEFASEERDRLRASARFGTDMLVTLNDTLRTSR